mmetsp:Transcript_3986/g.7141  ORF Transcript_3986/g.7141 Transcript_3986/m.7141 type:complete len:112 (+) Transcript_3986:735-1070(+)
MWAHALGHGRAHQPVVKCSTGCRVHSGLQTLSDGLSCHWQCIVVECGLLQECTFMDFTYSNMEPYFHQQIGVEIIIYATIHLNSLTFCARHAPPSLGGPFVISGACECVRT